MRRHRQRQRLWVSQADILAGQQYQAAGHEEGVFSGFQHARQPVHRGIGIGAAHTLDKGGDDLIVLIAGPVVQQGPLLQRLFDRRLIDVPDALGIGWGGCRRQLQGVQRHAGIAVGHGDEVFHCVRRRRDVLGAQSPLRVGQGSAHQPFYRRIVQRFQPEDPTARQQSGVDGEARILGGRADEREEAAFHDGQHGILLRLIEAVNLVHEQDRAPVAGGASRARSISRPPQLGHAGGDGADPDELRLRHPGDHCGQGRLTAPRRPPQND